MVQQRGGLGDTEVPFQDRQRQKWTPLGALMPESAWMSPEGGRGRIQNPESEKRFAWVLGP